MSLKTWCILGMIVAVVLGFLRARGREGATKTAVIIVHTILFAFFLICTVILTNQGI